MFLLFCHTSFVTFFFHLFHSFTEAHFTHIWQDLLSNGKEEAGFRESYLPKQYFPFSVLPTIWKLIYQKTLGNTGWSRNSSAAKIYFSQLLSPKQEKASNCRQFQGGTTKSSTINSEKLSKMKDEDEDEPILVFFEECNSIFHCLKNARKILPFERINCGLMSPRRY